MKSATTRGLWALQDVAAECRLNWCRTTLLKYNCALFVARN
ncbi:hypothetical protein BVRB_8g193550 [Beta vulgaris subsp. vulgaris]|nr:hypothetical protein BVRB_8g193550 [Beta vulgaris subsp. vulgaris]